MNGLREGGWRKKEGGVKEGRKVREGREKKNVLASGPGIYFEDRETGTKRDDIPSESP